MPRRVFAAGRSILLQYPREMGVESDFIGCFVKNAYGLSCRLGKVRTIVDVGSNVGFFAVAARGHYPDAVIHVYEPNHRILPFLRANVSELGVNVYEAAVGSGDGYVTLNDSGPSNQARTETSDHGDIPLVGLDRVIERIGGQLDLLKLDCEGAEWDLFQLTDCWKNIRNLRMEYHLLRGETYAQLEAALNKLGFTIVHCEHDLGFGIVWATRPL